MNNRWYIRIFVLLCAVSISGFCANAQMSSVVNSLADDNKAHPWDDPDTDPDESMDGVCKDELGRCTLRAALEEANGRGDPANVTFSVGGILTINFFNGPFSIPSNSVIDGGGRNISISGGHQIAFLFEVQDQTTIKGLGFVDATDAIDISGDNNVIGADTHDDGNAFLGMSQNGVMVIGNNNTIKGNFIGILPDNSGTYANQTGVFLVGSYNTVGGTSPGQRNFISGNSVAGISMAGDTTGGGPFYNRVIGNYIGTDTTGTQAKGNQHGVEILNGIGHTIGGTNPGERNVISGNHAGGVLIGIMSDAEVVRGNYIGTDPAGLTKVANRDGIILAPGSQECIIDYNEIRFNTHGILMNGLEDPLFCKKNYIYGNIINYNDSGAILMDGNVTDNIIGSSLTTDYDENTIFYNGKAGSLGTTAGIMIVATSHGAPVKNTIRKNAFLDNGDLAILFDIAGGVQNDIKPPAITTYADVGGGLALVTGTHQIPGALVDVYTGERVTGTYQGRRWLGSGLVAPDQTYSFSVDACNCSKLVATATDAAGNTSEFTTSAFDVTDVRPLRGALPSEYALGHAYPNPFNPSTTIQYELPEQSHVSLKIYDVLGREVETLIDEVQEAGFRSITWNAGAGASGVYFYRISAAGTSDPSQAFLKTRKIVLSR